MLVRAPTHPLYACTRSSMYILVCMYMPCKQVMERCYGLGYSGNRGISFAEVDYFIAVSYKFLRPSGGRVCERVSIKWKSI